MALSFEESKQRLHQQLATPAVMSMQSDDGIMTLESGDGIGMVAAYSEWTKSNKYDWYDDYSDDKISTVDKNKNILVDASQVNISQEENSQFIPFEMSRYYDGFDLMKATIWIYYLSSDGYVGASKAVNVSYDTATIKFGWLVDDAVTHIAGNLKFEIRAIGTNSKGDAYIWKSKTFEKMNVLQSLIDNGENIDLSGSWVQELIEDVTESVAGQIASAQIGEQVKIAEAAANRAENAASNAGSAVSNALSNYYNKTEVDTAISNVEVDLTGYATEDYVKDQIDAIPEVDFTGYATEDYVKDQIDAIPDVDLSGYALKTEIPTNVSDFTNDAGYLTEHQSLAGLATEEYVQGEIEKVDVSDQLTDYAKSADVYTKTEVDDKIETLTTDVETNKTSILSLGTVVGGLQETVNSIDTSPRLTYDIIYNDVEDLNGGENVLVLYEIENEGKENEVKTPKAKYTIVGGSGGGSAGANDLKIYFDKDEDGNNISQYVFTEENVNKNNAIIYYEFVGTDSVGDSVSSANATWQMRIGNSGPWTTIAAETVYPNIDIPFNVSKYISTGSYQFKLSVSDESGGFASKTWTVQKIDIGIKSSFNDKDYIPIGRSAMFTYTPSGNIEKTIHFKLDGVETTINTSVSGILQTHPIEPQSHGAHLLEVWITATVNNIDIETDHIYRDLIWYDEQASDAVIGCIYRNDLYGKVEARQYDTTEIIYNVFDPTTSYPVIYRYVDGDLVGTDTATGSQNKWIFQTDKIGEHTLKIVVRDTEVTIVVNVNELGIDVSPITHGLEIDFNPVGVTNNSANKLWSNEKYSMTVSPNFDWVNGGYKTDDNGDSYFLVKTGTRTYFDYKMFDGGTTANPSIVGSEMKIIFMTEKVKDKDAVWFSNVEKTTKEVDGITQTTNVGIQLGVHEGWLKTNNASDTDVISADGSDAVAATNTYLYMPYSEEDIIEMDINIDTIDRDDENAKAFVMAYEDGVPSKAYVYDSSDRFYQFTPQIITIGSDHCDVRIYRMKIYSTSLTTENIMKNFIADARNSTVMLDRYNRNSIYYNREKNTYTPYSGEGVIDPEKLAPIVPNVKILMLETDHFTTSKKTFVKSAFRCIHAPGGDMFKGDALYDNWMFENGWHSGQGTTSDNYGNSSRNVDFLFNCDGVHKPSDKVNAESNYISQVTIGYGTENAVTEKVTDWKGDTGKVSLTRTSVPNNFFNFKANVASSENANNMILQKRYNDFLPYISPAKQRNENVKCSMEFVPAILFIRETNPDISTHNEFLDTEWHFYSLGNIGDSKKTDYTRAYDPEDMNEFTIEISDNTKNNATFQSGIYLDADGNRQVERFTITESEDDGDIILTPVSIDKPQSFVYPITMEEWDNENNMRRWCIDNEKFDGDHSFEARYACCGDYRDGKLVNDTSGRGKEQMKLNEGVWRAFYRWVITSTDKEFVDELDEWCVRSAMEFFYAFTHIYTMMDNRAKNTFWHFAKTGTYRKVSKPVPELLHVYCELIDGEYVPTADTEINSDKTYYTQHAFDMHDYDNDTALGINNNGELVFPYGKEDSDYNIEGKPESGYVFNGATSVFWCRLRDLLSSEIQSTFQNVASECFSATHLINQFDAYQECYPEEIWRLDIQRKYIRTFTGESIDNSKPKRDVQYLRDMMQGRKKYQRRQWVRDQEIYFGTMNLMNTVVGDNNRITFRCFTPTGNNVVVKPDYTLKITPSSDMYLSVMFGNGGVQRKRAKAGVEYEIECPLSTMDDTQVTIYGANRIQALNDLSSCYIAANNFSMATKLRKLVIGNATSGYNNSRLVSLTLGNNELLEELDIRNCGNLTGSLNLTYCNNLLKLYAEGTKITGVTFATNGKIEVAHLPNTINTLTMRNLYNLIDFQASLDQLETLTLQGGNLDSLDIVTNCIDTLNVLSLYDINWRLEDAALLDRIFNLFYSMLSGYVYIPIIREIQEYNYENTWPDLDIDPGHVIKQVTATFLNADGTVLDVQYVDIGEEPVDPTKRENNPIATPTLESTVSTNYTFAGWDKDLGKIFENSTYIAQYTESVREYTIQYISKGKPVMDPVTAPYGTTVLYSGDIPTYTIEESVFKFSLFDGWDKSGYVDGDKIINAKFDSCEYKTGYFDSEEKKLSKLRPVELYMMVQLGKSGIINLNNYFEGKEQIKVKLGSDFVYGDDEVVLIDDKTVFNGINDKIDTGINLLSEDRGFVLAIDCQFDNNNANNAVLAQCFSGRDTSGFKLSYNNGVKLAWGSSSATVGSSGRREMIVIRHVAGDDGLYVYSSNTEGYSSSYVRLDGIHSMKHNVSLVFGCGKLEDGSYEHYGKGVIYWSKLWYTDLGEGACTKLASWPHEEITLEVCCEVGGALKRYYLSESSGLSSITFIASNLLAQPMAMSSSSSNAGGWAAYPLNTYLNTRIYNAFPDAWKQLMKRVIVKSSVGNQSMGMSDSHCYVFIPSIAEMGVEHNVAPYASEGTQIAHMTDNSSRVCDNNVYWTRSPSTGWTSYVYSISASGSGQPVTQLNNKNYIRIMISI